MHLLHALLNHALFFLCFSSTASHFSPAQDKEKAEGIRRKFLKERLSASQLVSKRLLFESLFVLLTDRRTFLLYLYAIHERCCPFSSSLIIHAALTQPEHLILLGWMGLEPPMKNEFKTRPYLNTRV